MRAYLPLFGLEERCGMGKKWDLVETREVERADAVAIRDENDARIVADQRLQLLGFAPRSIFYMQTRIMNGPRE